MALDVTVIGGAGPVRTFNVEAGAAASIEPGKPVKRGGTGNNYVTLLAAGDPEIGTDLMVGIAASTSTDTAAADGTVEVQMIVPNETILRCAAETPGNLADTILLDNVTFDEASGTYTVDENEGDDPAAHGLTIVAYDADKGTVDFKVQEAAML